MSKAGTGWTEELNTKTQLWSGSTKWWLLRWLIHMKGVAFPFSALPTCTKLDMCVVRWKVIKLNRPSQRVVQAAPCAPSGIGNRSATCTNYYEQFRHKLCRDRTCHPARCSCVRDRVIYWKSLETRINKQTNISRDFPEYYTSSRSGRYQVRRQTDHNILEHIYYEQTATF